MNTYTLEQLTKPETYSSDSELATFARRCSEKAYQSVPQGTIAFGDFKRQFLVGQHAEFVFNELQARHQAEQAAKVAADIAMFAKTAKIEAALAKLGKQIPGGVTVDVSDKGLILKAPWDGGDLAERLGRLGGKWNRENKCFDVPIDAAPSLGRVLANWRKAQDERDATEAEAKRKAEQKRQAEQAARDAEWARQREQDATARKAQQERQARAVASRVKVTAGQYKVGDLLEDKQITGFGKVWQESTLPFGQLWQECDYGRCENEPVCVSCGKCSKHCGCGEQVTYCYAYFE